MHRPGQVGLAVGHDLPDGVEDVGVGAELEHPVEEPGGELGLAHARCEVRVHVGHRLLGDPEPLAHDRELVGGLHQACRAGDVGRRPRRPLPEQARVVAVHRGGEVVDRHDAARAHEPGEHRGERGHALVEVEVDGAVHVGSVETDAALGRGRARVGERREEVRLVIARDQERDRSLHVGAAGVGERPGGAGRVGHVAAAEEQQRVDPLRVHARAGGPAGRPACGRRLAAAGRDAPGCRWSSRRSPFTPPRRGRRGSDAFLV